MNESHRKMAAEIKKEIQLEIAHVLFIDIVGYSKLSNNDQHAAVEELTRIVRASEQFQRAEAASRLTRIPTGDGMALAFYTSPEAPAQCAVEISRALKEHPRLQLRMGIHSGPVSGVVDVNEGANLAGAGLNIAHRVMDCGDAVHIRLSLRVTEDLEGYQRWRPLLHVLGTYEVKHGVSVSVVNLYDDQFGNAKLPQRFETVQKRRTRLRWAAMAATLVALAVVVAGIATFSRYRVRSTLAAPAAPEKSIAVLHQQELQVRASTTRGQLLAPLTRPSPDGLTQPCGPALKSSSGAAVRCRILKVTANIPPQRIPGQPRTTRRR